MEVLTLTDFKDPTKKEGEIHIKRDEITSHINLVAMKDDDIVRLKLSGMELRMLIEKLINEVNPNKNEKTP